MAKKDNTDKVKKKIKKKAEKETKKFVRSHTKEVLIAILVIVLIAAIVLASIYFLDRPLFDKIFHIGANNGDTAGGSAPPSELAGDTVEVTFFNVGQGDSIFVRFPDGKNMMIDAGTVRMQDTHPYKNVKGGIKQKLFDELDAMGVKTIDAFILTHSDADHCTYMDDIIGKYDVKNIFVPALTYDDIPSGEKNPDGNIDTKVFRDAMEAAKAETYVDENGKTVKANVVENVGDITNLTGENYTVKSYCRDREYYSHVRNAKTINGVSPLTFLEFGGRTVLFTGDAEGDKTDKGNNVETWFIAKGIEVDVDVLKVGHHGSADCTTTDFLNWIDPEYAVISSSGEHPTFKHPRPEPLERLKNYKDVTPDDDFNGIDKLYRTDLNGDIVLKIGANGGMTFTTDREATVEELYTPAPQTTASTDRVYLSQYAFAREYACDDRFVHNLAA